MCVRSYPYGSGRKSDTVLLISDAFQDLSTWNGFMPSSDFEGVAIDTHIYQVFSPEVRVCYAPGAHFR